jgi:TRAP transporter TAXI family solute receptor
MTHRHRLSWWLAGVGVLIGVLVLAIFARGADQTVEVPPQRVAFQISAASTSTNDFFVGQLLSGILSHPPGISRCEAANLCGPAGLIVSTRVADSAVANILAVNTGAMGSGIAQADLAAQAANGLGAFANNGPAIRLRTIANLYSLTVHLVAGKEAGIESVADLRGKRVSLSTEDSGTIVTARAVLQAYRVPEWRLSRSFEPPDTAARMLRDGELDAFFFVGGAPVALIEQLLGEGIAVLIPLDGVGRDRLVAEEPYLSAYALPAGTYPGIPATETVSVGALWITNMTTPDELVYAMVKAVYNPQNRPLIEARFGNSDYLELNSAMMNSPLPFHTGVLQFFAEAGVLPAPANPVLPVPKPEL